jgi:O-antigen ligase
MEIAIEREALPSAAWRPQAGRPERLALRVLQAGAVAVVLAATTYKVFELDRYFVPKELVLHLTALLAGLLALRAFRRAPFSRVDLLLLAYLGLGLVSAVLATNPWLAARALAISVSGVAVFWSARALACAGLGRALLGAVALAVVAGAVTSLLQTYGVTTELFSLNRAPGGTLGNRNFISHMAAFGLPVVLLVAVTARHAAGYLAGAVGGTVVMAALVLTRSRAGWLAFAAAAVVFAVAMVAAPALRTHGRTWLRLAGILIVGAAGVAAGLLLPNTLNWRSDNPYVESIRGVANYQEGSGRGRLVQYRQSLGMAMRHPLLGVGPGNWAVQYPAHAAPADPSLDRSAPGTTSNPWPSSDWVAFASERGLPAAVILLLAFVGMLAGAARRLVRTRDPVQALAAATLIAMLAAVTVAGVFDAVLLLALPTLLAWAALGVLWAPPVRTAEDPRHDDTLSGPEPPRTGAANGVRGGLALVALLVVALGAGVGAARSAAQLAGIVTFASRDDAASLARAARIDPGNYRLRMRLARSAGSRSERCEHARAAHALFPHAEAARNLDRRCGR